MADTHTPARGGAPITVEEFGWRHASRKIPTLKDVNLTIDPGEKVLLVGSSGSGKSTLLAGLAGVLGGDDGDQSGQILVRGKDPRHHRGIVGLVLQDPDSQVICSRVGDDVVFGCENLRYSREEMWRRARWALDLVGLDLDLNHPTQELSGGQKQRLALAGVMAMGAQVILLDEPTANLDPAGVVEVRDAVTHAVAETGATLIVVEHRVGLWADHLDRTIVVGAHDQGIIADGKTQAVIAEYGEQLARQGVWLPGLDPVLPPANPLACDPSHHDCALWATDLLTGWGPDKPVGKPQTVALPTAKSTVITGPNGAGKSTLALTLAGLLKPLAGDVTTASAVAQGLDPSPHKWPSAKLASRIGFVFQDPEHQFVARTVREELEIGPAIMAGAKMHWWQLRHHYEPTPADAARIDELLVRLRLDHLAEANPFTLSGGQKRRLSVASALVTSPSVVLFDEPTFGQDRRTFVEMVKLLRELVNEGVTIASITHDPFFVGALADHTIAVSK